VIIFYPQGEEDQRVLEEYFREVVLPLSIVPEGGHLDNSSHHNNSFVKRGSAAGLHAVDEEAPRGRERR
jgi:hypothetical protein